MEKPIKMDDWGVQYPIFGNTHMIRLELGGMTPVWLNPKGSPHSEFQNPSKNRSCSGFEKICHPWTRIEIIVTSDSDKKPRVQYFTNLGLQELAANNSFLMGIYQANMGYMFMEKMLGLVGSKDVRLEDHTVLITV